MTAFGGQVNASQPETQPHVFTHARILYQISGRNVDEAAVVRAIELSATKYCPAQAMLSKVFPIDLVYEIYDEDGQLIKKGDWKPA